MIGSVCDGGGARAILETRANPDSYSRIAVDWDDTSDQHLRPKDAVTNIEPRTEISDLDGPPLGPQRCLEDRGVVDISLADTGLVLDLDRKHAVISGRSGSGQQGMENGIAVETGQAAPHDLRVPIDQRADRAVADEAKVETAQCPVILRVAPVTVEAMRGTRPFRRPGRLHASRRGRP